MTYACHFWSYRTIYTATQMLKWKQLMPLIPIYAAVQM